MSKVDLSSYNNSWFEVGASKLKVTLWYIVNAICFKSYLIPFSKIKVNLLKMFGAEVGKNVVIKPCVNIKYPWKLIIKDNVWIGEEVWIDNLGLVQIGSNACLSQGALLLCGNHNYKKSTFDLMVGDITLRDGAWVGAKATVCPGVTIDTNAILSAGSVVSKNMEKNTIYRGNPAIKVGTRIIE